MEKYLLNSEKDKINILIEELKTSLKTTNDLEIIKERLTEILKNTKDYSIEDILNYLLESLTKEISPLLTENYTPGLQVGIQNDYFNLLAYGGYYNGEYNSKEITDNTLFSFDSISKIITSIIAIQETRNKDISLQTTINELNHNFMLDSSIEAILKFTAMIKTDKRVDNLPKDETIEILKKCKENLEEKSNYKNFYQYNDIGFMILRLSINDFLKKLNDLLQIIDKNNLTYQNFTYKDNITGGKLEEEYITPDRKGRDIPFPGHTGLYGNITGLLNLFHYFLYTDNSLTEEERKILFAQPYQDPTVYDKDKKQLLGKNGSKQYMAKISGIYRKPDGINDDKYSKMSSCDMSELTTDNAKASTGTCGAWVVTDKIDNFGTYTGGLLTNPYSYVNKEKYPDAKNPIPNTNITVNQNGVILGYQAKLNKYKEIITEYGLILELITKYIEEIDNTINNKSSIKLVKKI